MARHALIVCDWFLILRGGMYMLLDELNSVVMSIVQITRLNEPVLMMVLGILLLIIVQGIRQRMKRKVKL